MRGVHEPNKSLWLAQAPVGTRKTEEAPEVGGRQCRQERNVLEWVAERGVGGELEKGPHLGVSLLLEGVPAAQQWKQKKGNTVRISDEGQSLDLRAPLCCLGKLTNAPTQLL